MNLELAADRDQAQTVPCPTCAAEPGVTCTNLRTGNPLEHLPAHDSRMRAAGVMHAPLDPRDLRHDPDRHGRTRW